MGVAMAGGVPRVFPAIAVCDGIAMGHIGMKYSLVTRDLICDSTECMALAHQFDALVMVPNCDKNVPGLLMAAARVNVPTVFVSGGPMLAGHVKGKKRSLSSMFEAVGSYAAGTMSEEDVCEYEEKVCPTCGSCSGMYTANSMNCLTEALGMGLQGNGTIPAVYSERIRLAKHAGMAVMEMYKKDIRPRDIMTKEAILNALTVDMALGCPTNSMLHLPAIAHEFGIEIDADTFERIHKSAHYLLDVRPAGRWPSEYVYYAGGVPAIAEVQFSLVSNRGCFGGCSFCALTFHQGRIVQTRSHDSLLAEAARMTQHPDFKGYIHDVGGPTANFRQPACEKQLTHGACQNRQCLFPTPCRNLRADHTDYVNLLRELRAIPGVKKVFIRSGIRFDYLLADEDPTFLRELVEYHVSGQLKVAPEHVSDPILRYMGKPRHAVYEKFCRKYAALNEKLGKKQYLVPYLMSSHPGCGLREAVELAEYVRDLGYMPEQVQDFYPTPSTLSTVMYYTGLDPRTMEPVYVPTDPHEKEMQRALIQYRDPKNYALIHEALVKAGRTDLIGYGPKCLIRPRRGEAEKAPHPAQKQPAQKRPAQKRERPAEKKPAAKPRKAQPAAKEPRRVERGEAFGKPTAAQLRQAERYLKTRKKKPAVKKPTKPKASGGREV